MTDLLDRHHVGLHSLHVGFPGDLSLRIERHEDGDDVLTISMPNGNMDHNVGKFAGLSEQHFGPMPRGAQLKRTLGPDLAEFYNRREAGLLRLEEVSGRLIEDTEEYRRRLDQQVADAKRQLEEEHASRLRIMETESQALLERYSAKETALEEEKRALDDRSARHARRQDRKDLKTIIAGRSKQADLTRETKRKRWPVHAIFVALLCFSALLVGWALREPPVGESGGALWIHLFRLPAGAIGFALTAAFYIRWNDQWFKQHADEEVRLRQLELDVDRASWVVEIAAEWAGERGTQFPPELLERLSTGLFERRDVERVRHPAEDLSSALLGASSAIQLRTPALDLTLDRKGVQKFKNDTT